MLRLDDTDLERSTQEYADGIVEDLKWLGMSPDFTAKQSDRFTEYDKAVTKLKADGLLYPCYETPDELEMKRKRQRLRNLPPVYDRGSLDLTSNDIAKLEAEGRRPHWRFKLSGGVITWNDVIRGESSVDTKSLSDPILIRGDGSFLYTLPSVVDDIDFKMTHVIRGEDHVTNSGAQIEIFKALGGPVPEMGHFPFLVGTDGKGLSKRLGSLSIKQLREDGYEPMAITSVLAKIGTSDPVEPRHSLDALVEECLLSKISRSPAKFDEADLRSMNAKLLHEMSFDEVEARLEKRGLVVSPLLWETVHENIEILTDVADWIKVIEGPVEPLIDDKDFLVKALDLLPDGEMTEETWGAWTGMIKEATGAKGKSLFMPLRKALTGLERGPSMQNMLVLIGTEKVKARLNGGSS
jgi:glutamyl-tRNA synthetase